MSDATVRYRSALTFTKTVGAITAAIESAGLTIFATIDHAKLALDVGLQMPPTLVVFYGNPRGGTPLMMAAPDAALDLPLRVLIREDAACNTFIVFRNVVDLAAFAGITPAMTATLMLAQSVLVKAVR